MSQFASDVHKRTARMLGYTLTLGDYEAWAGFSLFLIARLEQKEILSLAWAAMRALDPEQAQDTAETILRRPAPGWPQPPTFGLMYEAAFWADHASEEELRAYCLATFRAMRADLQAAFLATVQRGKSA